MKRISSLSVLIFVLFLASIHGAEASQQRAVPFLKGVLSALVANDYATAWQSLHPLHQAVAPEAEYVGCEALTPVPGRLGSLVAVRSQQKAIAIAGLEQRARGVVVTFRVRLVDPVAGGSAAFMLKAAAVRVADRWAWMLPRARYELYADDACGSL